MTPIELERTVTRLGCNPFDPEEFTHLGTIALRRLYDDLKIKCHGVIYAHGIIPASDRPDVFHKGGENNSYPLTGKAFCAHLRGASPQVLVNTGEVTTNHLLPNGHSVLKGFISNNMGIISFIGNYDYYVEHLYIFDQILTTDKTEIPEGGEFTVYGVKKYCPGFLSFASSLTDEKGNALECARADGDEIIVKSDYTGEIYFDYTRGPLSGIEYDDENEIDLEERYLPILVVLFLAYYFMDVDAAKGERYMEEYYKLIDSIPEKKSYIPTSGTDGGSKSNYKIMDGWA